MGVGRAKTAPKVSCALKTGEVVPESGIYLVSHAAHRLPREIMLVKDQRFPRCGKCAKPVKFKAIQVMPYLERRGHVLIYELPELEAETDPGAQSCVA